MSRARFVRRVAGTTLVVLGISCGGPTEPPPPPPTNKVSVTLSVPPTVPQLRFPDYPMASVTISALVSSSLGKPTTLTCALDGAVVPCNTPEKILPGTHTVCAKGESPGAVPVEKCGEVSVTLLLDQKQVVGFDANGNEYIPVGSWYVMGPDSGPRDSAQVGSDGLANLNSRYIGMGNVPVDFRGDAILKPSFGRTSPEFFWMQAVAMGSRVINTPVCATTGPAVAVTIDLDREGFTPPPSTWQIPQNLPLYIRTFAEGGWFYHDGSWPELPVKVAFDSVIAPNDSARFWFQADSINRAFCQERIRPANRSEVDPGGIVVHFAFAVFAASVGGLPRDYRFGSVTVDTTVFSGERDAKEMLWHEFGHAVQSLGHECQYVSNMWSSCAPPGGVYPGIQKKDVAYPLWRERLVAIERKYNTRIALAWIHQGERRELNLPDLPEEPVVWINANGSFGTVSQPGQPMIQLSPASIQSPPKRPAPANLLPAVIHDRMPYK